MSTIKRGKRGKLHYPPSYYRYNERKPGIFIRFTKEEKEALDKYRGTMNYEKAIMTLLNFEQPFISKLNNNGEEHENLKIEVVRDENELKEPKNHPLIVLKADKENNDEEEYTNFNKQSIIKEIECIEKSLEDMKSNNDNILKMLEETFGRPPRELLQEQP